MIQIIVFEKFPIQQTITLNQTESIRLGGNTPAKDIQVIITFSTTVASSV